MELLYVVEKNNNYEELYTFRNSAIDELYARQLCNYLIIDGKQYELISNEMKDNQEILVLKDMGTPATFPDETNISDGLRIEFRHLIDEHNMPLLFTRTILNHNQAIRFLLKDWVQIPEKGMFHRDSAELDNDRGCYVIYVTSE
ncbi:MAG: RNA helicase [Bacillaceae bacterium]